MTPKYIFVKSDGQDYSVCNSIGLNHAISLVRGQMRAVQGADFGTNLEIVLQAAETYRATLSPGWVNEREE